MNGGLGNQLFQYILYRFIEENSGDDCYIDDSDFFHWNSHFGYEIKKIFGLTPNLLSEYFDNDVWKEVLAVTKDNINIIDFFKQNGLPMNVVSEGSMMVDAYSKRYKVPYIGVYTTLSANSYAPEIAQKKGNVYYYGYWINAHWFQNIRDQIIQELKFPDFDDDYNKNMAEKICSSHSVGIHVRRGDFIDYGWALDLKWYRSSITHMKLVINDPVYYIFSDDLQFCRSNLETLGFAKNDNIVFVEGNTGGKNWRDMQLISLCKNLIIANSSFSYLGALLNQNPNKYVLNPTTRMII